MKAQEAMIETFNESLSSMFTLSISEETFPGLISHTSSMSIERFYVVDQTLNELDRRSVVSIVGV